MTNLTRRQSYENLAIGQSRRDVFGKKQLDSDDAVEAL